MGVWMRALLSGLLVLASLVLGTAAFSAAWLERNVVAAEGFAELGEPLGRDPGFQAELREALAQQAADSANVPGPLAGLVAPAVERVLQGLQEAPGYGEAWTESLEASHQRTFSADDAGPAPAVLDLSPLARLATERIGEDLGVPLPAPGDVVADVGPATDWPARIASLAGTWPALAVGAGLGALLALAVARRRGAALAWLGAGVVVVGAVLWFAAGAVPSLAADQSGASPVASAFAAGLAERAAASLHGWLIPALLGGGILLVLGLLGMALAPRRR